MARDDAARDSEIERSPLDRRSSPSLARANGAAVATVSADEPRTSAVGTPADRTTDVRFPGAAVSEGHYGTN